MRFKKITTFLHMFKLSENFVLFHSPISIINLSHKGKEMTLKQRKN